VLCAGVKSYRAPRVSGQYVETTAEPRGFRRAIMLEVKNVRKSAYAPLGVYAAAVFRFV